MEPHQRGFARGTHAEHFRRHFRDTDDCRNFHVHRSGCELCGERVEVLHDNDSRTYSAGQSDNHHNESFFRDIRDSLQCGFDGHRNNAHNVVSYVGESANWTHSEQCRSDFGNSDGNGQVHLHRNCAKLCGFGLTTTHAEDSSCEFWRGHFND